MLQPQLARLIDLAYRGGVKAERAGDYDYFMITAGPQTLQERFAHLDSVTGFNRFRLGQS